VRIAGADAFLMLEAAEDYDRGIPPISGGRDAQAQVFLDAVRFIREDRRALERPEADDEDGLLLALLKRR
jgi:nitrogen-specific signal transduction histidine kinase